MVYYYCVVTQSVLNCDATSTIASITITPAPTFSTQPIGYQKLCVGGTAALSVSYSGGSNPANYQWYNNNTNSTIGGTPIVGANSNAYIPPTNIAGTTYYYCLITFSNGGCTSIISNPAQVDVLIDPIINTQPLFSQTICEGTTIGQPLVFSYSGGTGATSITWYQVGPPNVLINGITDTFYQPPAYTLAGTYKYLAIVTDSGSGCQSTSTLHGEIIVNPTPYLNNIDDTIICNNKKLNINISTTLPSNIIWFANQNTNVLGEQTTNQTSSLISDSLTNNTNVPQFITYNITPTSFPQGCPGPDSTVTVQVQPDVILSNVTNIEICSGSPVNAILTTNIPSTFNWFVSINNPNVTGESLLPSTSQLITDVLINNTLVNQVVIYSIFPTSLIGSCNGQAQTFVVTVKPSLSLLNDDTVTICSGNRVNLTLIANTNVTLNWYADQSPNVLNETTSVVTSTLINDSLINNTNTVQQVTYHVTGTSTINGCSTPILPITVFVNPIPSVDPIDDSILCNDITFSPISINGPVNGTIYNWVTSDTSIGIGAQSGINSIPGFIATNRTSSLISSNFIITPLFINNNVTCSSSNELFTISVLPTPSIYPLSDISICNGIQVPQKLVSGPIPGTIFNWTNSNISISLNSSGSGSIPSFNASNPTTLQQFSTVAATPMIQQGSVQCFGPVEDYIITVNPTPHVLNADIEICSGHNTNILLNATIPSSFVWNATPNMLVFNETSFPLQSSILINDSLFVTSTSSQTVDYHVRPTSIPYGCIGPDSVVKVVVNPIPVVDFTILNTSFCDLQPVNFQNNSQGILNFIWNFGDGNSSFLFNPSNTYTSTGNYNVKLIGINPTTGCSDSLSKPVVISKTPNPNFSYSDSVGCDKLDVIFTADTIDLNYSYLWDFGNGNYSQQFGITGHQYNQAGCYDINLTVTSKKGCVSSRLDTSAICVYEQPIALFTADRYVFSSLETPVVQFTNQSQFATVYFWKFGDNQTSFTEHPIHTYADGANKYIVKLNASNSVGCQDSAFKTITVIQDIAIYVPNTFTPNKDGINDIFLPTLTDGFIKETYHLTIFNRWGELIFESRDENLGWDGLCKNTETEEGCQIGTYIWKINIEVSESSEIKFYIGHVNLIR